MRKGPGALKRIGTCPARQARRARRKGAPRLKREFSLILALLLALNLAACGGNAGQAPGKAIPIHRPTRRRPRPLPRERICRRRTPLPQRRSRTGRALRVTVGGQTFLARLYDSGAARALAERLPLTLEMSEMNGNEKYCYLDDGLPTDSRVPSQIRAGDLMLYGADCLVLFYESFSTTYRYTPLGGRGRAGPCGRTRQRRRGGVLRARKRGWPRAGERGSRPDKGGGNDADKRNGKREHGAV